jgi:hypothetical protein
MEASSKRNETQVVENSNAILIEENAVEPEPVKDLRNFNLPDDIDLVNVDEPGQNDKVVFDEDGQEKAVEVDKAGQEDAINDVEAGRETSSQVMEEEVDPKDPVYQVQSL